jgi:thioredoxin reductase (NADPH)
MGFRKNWRDKMEHFDFMVLGAGPAGLTAGLYGARAGLRTAVVEAGEPGGQVLLTEHIANYPGFLESISGSSLIDLFVKQAEKWGCQVISHAGSARLSTLDGIFQIENRRGCYSAKTVIIATGCEPNRLNVEGESRLANAGISYCAVCDGSFFEGMDVAVIGGGDSALEESLYLSKICRKVTIIHRRDQFRGTDCLQRLVKENPRIELCMSTVVEAFQGGDMLDSLRLKRVDDGSMWYLPASGAFIYVGQKPRSTGLPAEIVRDEAGWIITDDTMATSVPGVFAAGDVRKKIGRQISTAVGDGATAALAADRYLTLRNYKI